MIQKDYSRYDMSGIEASIDQLYHQDICILVEDHSAVELAKEFKAGIEDSDKNKDLKVQVVNAKSGMDAS